MEILILFPGAVVVQGGWRTDVSDRRRYGI